MKRQYHRTFHNTRPQVPVQRKEPSQFFVPQQMLGNMIGKTNMQTEAFAELVWSRPGGKSSLIWNTEPGFEHNFQHTDREEFRRFWRLASTAGIACAFDEMGLAEMPWEKAHEILNGPPLKLKLPEHRKGRSLPEFLICYDEPIQDSDRFSLAKLRAAVTGIQAPSPASTGETNHSRNESNVSDKEIEQGIVEKGLTAPRVTPEQIEKVIVKEEFFRLTDVLTVCVLTLANGFTVTGESACASPENFNEEIGNKIARENAKQKIWPLEGYLLKQRLAATPKGGDFGNALTALRSGFRVARRGWNGKGIFIELQVPDQHSKMSSPYIFIGTTGLQTDNPDAPRSRVPWLASQTDMLAEDWSVVA